MNKTMITATNTLSQLQKQLDVISHNMANLGTTGYKRNEATFTDLLVKQINNNLNTDEEIGRLTPNGIRQGVGAKLGQVQMVMSQGALKRTERDLDTAFTTQGQFYRILVQQEGEPPEIQYSRDGAFYLSPYSETENMLVTRDGNPVLDESDNPIVINGQANGYTVTEEGSLIVHLENSDEDPIPLGVTRINYPQFLERKGNNLLGLPTNINELNVGNEVFTDLNGARRDEITILQGALEESNVDLSKEMTDLMTAQRSYQFQSRSVNMADQMMGLINGMR